LTQESSPLINNFWCEIWCISSVFLTIFYGFWNFEVMFLMFDLNNGLLCHKLTSIVANFVTFHSKTQNYIFWVPKHSHKLFVIKDPSNIDKSHQKYQNFRSIHNFSCVMTLLLIHTITKGQQISTQSHYPT
jgi:hypothetical protein